jgi:hypothetical protein
MFVCSAFEFELAMWMGILHCVRRSSYHGVAGTSVGYGDCVLLALGVQIQCLVGCIGTVVYYHGKGCLYDDYMLIQIN